MLNALLNKIILMLTVFFLIGSTIFYVILQNFHEKEVEQIIMDRLILSESIQRYVSKYQKPTMRKLIKDGNLEEDYFEPSLMSSTFIVSHVNDIYEKTYEKKGSDKNKNVVLKFASDNPTNPSNKASPFESKILKKMNDSNISIYKEKINYKGEDTLFYAFPARRNTQACLQCHGDPKNAPKKMLETYGDKNGFHEKVGDVRAINIVYSAIDDNSRILQAYLIVEGVMLSIFIFIYFALRHFMIRLNEKDHFIAKQSKFAAMGEMIGMIAHQWRQPLTGMSMTVNNLLLDVELQEIDEERFKENLEGINKQIGYLSHTIDDFKNFFRPDNKYETVNLAKTIKEAYLIIDSSIKSHGIEIKVDISDELSVLTQKNDLTQIILNLVKNSIDAYEENKILEGRIIEISAVGKAERVEIFVKDYAGGIPKKIIDKIFDPYFSTKDKKNGTGLGLYMSKMIIEDHLSGYFDVSTHENTTTFKIALIKKDS